jgi:hypothetical protein
MLRRAILVEYKSQFTYHIGIRAILFGVFVESYRIQELA